jgi:hypothetical protein
MGSCGLAKLGPTYLVCLSPAARERLVSDEEGLLRELGVIPPEAMFNGVIDLGPLGDVKETRQCCVYNHVDDGGCKCTYTRTCYDCTCDELAIACGGKEAAAIPLDSSLEVLVDPGDLPRLADDPVGFFRSLNVLPAGQEFNGVLSTIDIAKLANDRWHVLKYCHIWHGECQSKYVICEAKAVPGPKLVQR